MANWELQLVSAVVGGKDPTQHYVDVKEQGITASTFGNAEARAVWVKIDHYYNRPEEFGRVPSLALIEELFPTLDLPDPQEGLNDLCTLVTRRYLKRKADELIEGFMTTETDDVSSSLNDLTQELTRLQETTRIQSDVNFSSCALQETLEEINRIEDTAGVIGMPFPWEVLNQETGGIHPGDFIILYALPKSQKTWIGLLIAVFLACSGRRVLVYSKEMTWVKVRRRIACLLGKVDYTKYLKGKLSEEEKGRILEAIEWFESQCPGDIDFTMADKPNGDPGSPREIRQKIDVYQPDFVLLDSAYMMEPPDKNMNALDWRAVALMSREFKQIAKKTNIPVLAIFQENERAALKYKGTRGTASVAMSTNIVQDCDLALRCVYNKLKEEISLWLPAARETRFQGLTINAKAAYDYTYAHDRLWSVEDCVESEKEDEMPEHNNSTQEARKAIQSLRTSFGVRNESAGENPPSA